jgi:hypothetical protein
LVQQKSKANGTVNIHIERCRCGISLAKPVDREDLLIEQTARLG